MKILLIGNSGTKANDRGGQTTKLRLYHKKMFDEGMDVTFIELEGFFKHVLSVFNSIKKGIKDCDRIVLISGERACKLLIPFINRINKRYKKVFVLPLVGSGILHFSIDYLSDEDKNKFLIEKHFELGKCRDKITKMLKPIDYILAETELTKDVYSSFYSLSNCYIINNFRDFVIKKNDHVIQKPIRLVFLSRVMDLKGIFDLMQVVNKINSNNLIVKLDIYGKKELSNLENDLFLSLERNGIRYLGPIDNSKVINVLEQYDLLVFPTKAMYEGTPGVIAESLIAGTPILTSDFPQAKYLLKDGFDSIFFKMFDKEDLERKLLEVIKGKYNLITMRNNAYESGYKFTYDYERDNFLKFVCGKVAK